MINAQKFCSKVYFFMLHSETINVLKILTPVKLIFIRYIRDSSGFCLFKKNVLKYIRKHQKMLFKRNFFH